MNWTTLETSWDPAPHIGPPNVPERPHTAVNRRTLRQIMAVGLDDILQFDRMAIGFQAEGENGDVRLLFEDGTSVTGDVLVAADGINSVVRRQLLPHVPVVDTGMRCLYSFAALTDNLAAVLPARYRRQASGCRVYRVVVSAEWAGGPGSVASAVSAGPGVLPDHSRTAPGVGKVSPVQLHKPGQAGKGEVLPSHHHACSTSCKCSGRRVSCLKALAVHRGLWSDALTHLNVVEATFGTGPVAIGGFRHWEYR
ncbi:FAD-dependent oxidoreductase [Streptomyces kronopolitis]|uniref:FAD-dependent oxidoreductase n=1 Tax=Streptomyces kronopolitis TaxID=1612435 RepID=UPI0020BF6276|nr:hypothetical protein [Streptomyces kronopolitis]MCL6299479.1 hypothetical protein [Streptomyces kronopolitis]